MVRRDLPILEYSMEYRLYLMLSTWNVSVSRRYTPGRRWMEVAGKDFPCHSSLLTNSSNESKSHTVLRTSLPQGSHFRAILRDFARFWELRRPSNGLSVNVLISQDMLECALEYRMVQLEYPEKNIDSTTTLRKRRILRALYSSFNCFSNSLPDARIAVQILCHIFLWRRRGGRSM